MKRRTLPPESREATLDEFGVKADTGAGGQTGHVSGVVIGQALLWL